MKYLRLQNNLSETRRLPVPSVAAMNKMPGLKHTLLSTACLLLAALFNGCASPHARTNSMATAPNVDASMAAKNIASAPDSNPTAGLHEYTDTYKVQQPYNLKVSDRFLETNGEYICWVQRGDKPLHPGSGTGPRTEMRWHTDWSRTEHMWEADVMVEPGTDHTCVMQIKSNTGGEAIYLQVQNNNLYNDNNLKTVLLPDCTGKWFHVVSA